MGKDKAKDQDELDERRRKIDALKAEARSFGVYCTSDRLNEVARVVNKLRAERAGKPPCYWLSYDRTAKECRICEVRHDCARTEEVPAVIPVDELKPVACRKCGAGQLEVELKDPAAGSVLDYGCTNKECTGTLSEQTRFVDGEEKQKKPRIRAERRVGKNQQMKTELDHAILKYVDDHPGCITRDIMAGLRGSAERKLKAVKALVDKGKLKRERNKTKICFWPAGTP